MNDFDFKRKNILGLRMYSTVDDLLTWIVAGVKVFESQRPGRRNLRDVLAAGLGRVEVRHVARQNDDTARRRRHLITVESFAEADVEDA
jgi:hypothetical protein